MEREEPKGICEKLFGAFSPKPALQSFRSDALPEETHVSTINGSNPLPPLPSQASMSRLGPQSASPIPRKFELGTQVNKPEMKKDNGAVHIEIVDVLPIPLLSTSIKEKENARKPPIPSMREKARDAKEVQVAPPQASMHAKAIERRKSQKKVASAAAAEPAVPKPDSINSKDKAEAPPIVPSSEVQVKKKEASTNIDEKASDYIKRARLKIRSTSNAGIVAIGRAISFK